MDPAILKTLLAERGHSCISVIIPLKDFASEGTQNPLTIAKAVGLAALELQLKLSKGDAEKYIDKLEKMKGKINLDEQPRGLGLFLSDRVEEIVLFHTEVSEKIVMGEHFELRDIRYELQQDVEYYVLSLNEKVANLYKSREKYFGEIQDKNFPVKFMDEYEYEKPSRGSSYEGWVKSTEKDKSVLEQIRVETFFRSLDKNLRTYLRTDTPLIVSAVEKELALFKGVTDFNLNMVGMIAGNYSHDIPRLASLAKDEMKRVMACRSKLELDRFIELSGTLKTVTGLRQVWKAAHEGKGLKLFVEKDFKKPAFIGSDEYHLFAHPPEEEYRVLTDAVDEVIETVIAKGGKIVYVENGALDDYENIGLELRYNDREKI